MFLQRGVSAKECITFCIEKLKNGKGGGKEDLANATFDLNDPISIEKLKETVLDYFKSRFIEI